MDSTVHLRNRAAAASQKDVILGMFFDSSLGHIAATRGQSTADVIRSEVLKGKSVVSFFRYPVSDLLTLVAIATEKQQPPNDYLLAEFGRAAVRVFFESPVGKTMIMLSGGNAHRILSSAPAGYKAVVSFGERAYRKISETEGEMTFKNDLLGPGWHMGIFDEALLRTSNLKVKLDVVRANDDYTDFTIKLSW